MTWRLPITLCLAVAVFALVMQLPEEWFYVGLAVTAGVTVALAYWGTEVDIHEQFARARRGSGRTEA